jgi:DNA polymerase-3 subunit gamma/tau
MADPELSLEAEPVRQGAAGETYRGETYRVVARRYRPQRFDELVGQEHVARGLSGAIAAGRVGHAYLFTGARGVGKTSAARIFAKALECERGPAAEPCNACDVCLAISAGQDVDVIEIDAASNRGIDEIRQLRQNVAVRPARGRFKLYIVDEVHMLTREAFNALLKTLEEPPPHVKFVLCTTEPEKLPITILSRCQRFDFLTVDDDAIERRLSQIAEAERVAVEDGALKLIARRAAGSMRDSQSLLEQLLGCAVLPSAGAVPPSAGAVPPAAGNGAMPTITVAQVHGILGTGREESIGRIVSAIASRDAAAGIAALDEAIASGADPGGVLEQVLASLRDSLLASVGVEGRLLRQGRPGGVDLAQLGRALGTETILAMLQILDHSLARMRTSLHGTAIAEMALVRLARLENLDMIAAVVERVASAASLEPPRDQKKKPPLIPPTAAAAREPAPIVGEPAQRTQVDEPPAPSRPVEPPPAVVTNDPVEAWRAAAASIGGLAGDFAATATVVRWSREDELEVALPAAAAAAHSFLARAEVASGIGEALRGIVGRQVRYRIVQAADAAETTPVERKPKTQFSQSAMLREAMDHPLVAHARTLFDATVRRVEPAASVPDEGGAVPE